MLIAPSIRSADWTKLGEEVRNLEEAGADMLHFDVADGHFINELSIGPHLIAALRKITQLPFDVHLMFENPEKIIPKYIEAGADIIIVHVEAVSRLDQTVEFIKRQGIKTGVALNPKTPIEAIRKVLPMIDKVNLMCVNPGIPGKLVDSALDRIAELYKIIEKTKSDIYIQADGAVSMDTKRDFGRAGAKSLVVGYPIFSRKGEYSIAIKELKL